MLLTIHQHKIEINQPTSLEAIAKKVFSRPADLCWYSEWEIIRTQSYY